MSEDKLKAITNNVVLLFPIYHRKLLDVSLEKGNMAPSSPGFRALNILSYYGSSTMSELGNKLGISKPHMTALANDLISKGLIMREHRHNDRRIVLIKLTAKGKLFVKGYMEIIKCTIKKNLAVLSRQDINKLYNSFDEIIGILSKLYDKKEFNKLVKHTRSYD